MKKIYIERKYNTKLAYQIHHILQAKKIEDQKQKIKEGLHKGQESPLIRDVIKMTRNERKTDRGKMTLRKDQTDRHADLSFEVAEFSKVLKNIKVKDAMMAKDR